MAGVSLPALAACTDNSSSRRRGRRPHHLRHVERRRLRPVGRRRRPSGRLVFKVKNTGSKVTEFYLYAEDGLRIVGEVENIGPGLSRALVVNADAGNVRPRLQARHDRQRHPQAPSPSPRPATSRKATGAVQGRSSDANAAYQEYVEDQSEQLLAGTKAFVAAYKAGDDARARTLYPTVRVHWERIEPVAESFGDLDPRMDAREADLEEGQKWTGWHRIEKDLWPPATGDQPYTALTQAERATYADRLLADTETLHGRIGKLTFTVDQIGNGAKSLLDEVATGKVTGEEEIWSHTDLYDFQANIDGARVAFEGLRPVLRRRTRRSRSRSPQRFAALRVAARPVPRRRRRLRQSYDKLDTDQVKQLSDAVNALSEPLSQLTAAVTL